MDIRKSFGEVTGRLENLSQSVGYDLHIKRRSYELFRIYN